VIHTDQDVVTVLVSQAKWDKTKRWVKWMMENVGSNQGLIHKELERCIGFLIYVTRTYRPMRPFLRGLHKTLDLWRGNRDSDGWKFATNMRADVENDHTGPLERKECDIEYLSDPPEFIHPVPRMKGDVDALNILTRPSAPPKVIRRKKVVATVAYGFGDASGKGFGYGVEIEGKVYEEFGQWSAELESKHSNYKELRNLVNAVENVAAMGLLSEAEVYLFTDNFTAECAYYRGGSNTSKALNELVFRLWQLQMTHCFELFVYHIAGTRMIECGIDGLSRGDKLEGIASGTPMITYIPIHLSPIERSPLLKEWLKNMVWDSERLGPLIFLTPEDWYKDMSKEGNFVWDVPPAAGEFAMQQLGEHTHIRPEGMHLFIIPRLCTSHWRKQLLKCCDLVLTIQMNESFWPRQSHEPLLMGIYFPLLPPHFKYRPWKLKHTKFVEDFEHKMRMLQSTSNEVDWSILRKFLVRARSISTMSDGLARELLQEKEYRCLSKG
jgi:hypothetical protein